MGKDDSKIEIKLKYADATSLPDQEREKGVSSAVVDSPFKNAAWSLDTTF